MDYFGVFTFPLVVVALLLVAGVVIAIWRSETRDPVEEQEMELFEASLGAYKNRRNAKVSIDLRRASDGGYRAAATRELFQNYQAASQKRDSDDFWLSALVAGSTGSPLLGFAFGGSIPGTLLGTLFHKSGNDDHSDVRQEGSKWLNMSANQGPSTWRSSDDGSTQQSFWSYWTKSDPEDAVQDSKYSDSGVDVDLGGSATDTATDGSSCRGE